MMPKQGSCLIRKAKWNWPSFWILAMPCRVLKGNCGTLEKSLSPSGYPWGVLCGSSYCWSIGRSKEKRQLGALSRCIFWDFTIFVNFGTGQRTVGKNCWIPMFSIAFVNFWRKPKGFWNNVRMSGLPFRLYPI
jgi:hypothetical protein